MIQHIDRKRLYFKDGYTYLNRNMIDLNISKNMYESLLNSFNRNGLNQYPDMSRIYNILGEYLDICPDNLCITRGVEGSIKRVFETLNLEGSTVAITTPNYAMYQVYAKMYNTNVITISTQGPDHQLSVNEIKSVIPHVKVLFLDNPKLHMPNCFNYVEIEEILSLCEKHNVILFLDEVYAGWEYNSYLSQCKDKFSDNLIISSGFSKLGFPGIKSGWMITGDKLKKCLDTTRLSYELDYFSCATLEFLIKNINYIDTQKQRILNIKNKWYDKFLSSKIFKVFDSASFVLRLYSEDSTIIHDTYNSLYNEKIVLNLATDNDLTFSVTTDKKIEKKLLKIIK